MMMMMMAALRFFALALMCFLLIFAPRDWASSVNATIQPTLTDKDGFHHSSIQQVVIDKGYLSDDKDLSILAGILSDVEKLKHLKSLKDSDGFKHKASRRLLDADLMTMQFQMDYADPSPNTNPNNSSSPPPSSNP